MLSLVAMLLFVVSGDAVVLHDAQIISACLNDHVTHKAIVSNGAELFGNATVCDNARVHGAITLLYKTTLRLVQVLRYHTW